MNDALILNKSIFAQLLSRSKRMGQAVFFQTGLAIVLSFCLVSSAFAKSDQHLTRQDIQKMIAYYAQDLTFVDASLALAVARVETNFYHVPHSSWGGQGVLQMPAGHHAGHRYALSAAQSIVAGLTHLDRLIEASGGDVASALHAYHGGATLKGWPNSRVLNYNNNYIANVMAARDVFIAEASSSNQTALIHAGFSAEEGAETHPSFIFQYSGKSPENIRQVTRLSAFNSDWPEWKKQLYFARNWLNEIAFIKSERDTAIQEHYSEDFIDNSNASSFVSRINRIGGYTGSSRMVTDDDF